MATPPPYSPNPRQYPPAQDPRQQVRDYARIQREQVRAQRQYWRAYWRGGRRPSITGPVVLLAIGVIALLVETGRLNGYAVWNWYAQWWPLLLIAAGVISLAEYFWDRDDPYAGRRGGGIFALLILLLFLGWAAHGARWWGHRLGMDGNDFAFVFGEEHDNDIQMDQAAPAAGTVNVQNPRGDVTVTGSTDGQIHLRAHEVVHTSSDKDAQKDFDQVRPRITASGSGSMISVPSRTGSAVDLTLSVPEGSFITVNAQHGDVSIEGVKNNVDVTDQQGDVKVDGTTGDVHARMNDGDFSAHAIEGQLFLNGHASDITLSEIKGQAVLDGEFFGDTHLEQMGGAVHFHSTRTAIDLPSLGGDLTLDSDDLTASQMGGPTRIITRSKNIDLTRAAGDLHIENSDGDVNVTAAVPLGNVEIMNRTGSLLVTVPESANFIVTASTTQDDDLQTDFPLDVTTSGDEKRISGMVGHGGTKLDLSTTHGNLELRKGGAELSAPEPPPAPAAPAAPNASKPTRHLRAPKVPVAPPTEQ
ncbi:MAG TPA: DUF4097 family beta strand repeat-containing protein [Silvibacterium sp.]|nr:DUF4097 family beta strand repeat-containing protein [Silvibacterium sp.]